MMDNPCLNDDIDDALMEQDLTLNLLREFLWRKGFILSIKRRNDPEYTKAKTAEAKAARLRARTRHCEACNRPFVIKYQTQSQAFCSPICYTRHRVENRA